jgi:processive 1,2-diacylglycerol beta-glucosyltransferase
LNRAELAQKFSLVPDKFTVLIVTGSFGIGPIEQIADSLREEAQVIAVCARNQELFQRLTKKNYPHLKIFGFVDNIQELMAVSDVIITKPGGLTTSEVLAMELPPLFICAIPGQETVNAQYLYSEGISRPAAGTRAIKDIVVDYKNNPQKILAIKEKIRRIKRPSAAEELYRAVC